jgi:hypothetical protein
MSGLGRTLGGENREKREAVAPSGCARASEKQRVEDSGCGKPPTAALPSPEKRGGLNGSLQHLPKVLS